MAREESRADPPSPAQGDGGFLVLVLALAVLLIETGSGSQKQPTVNGRPAATIRQHPRASARELAAGDPTL